MIIVFYVKIKLPFCVANKFARLLGVVWIGRRLFDPQGRMFIISGMGYKDSTTRGRTYSAWDFRQAERSI